MKQIIKYYYIFEKKDKKRFQIWLIENGKTRKEVASYLSITISYLNYIVNGDRYVTTELRDKFQELGFTIRKSDKGE